MTAKCKCDLCVKIRKARSIISRYKMSKKDAKFVNYLMDMYVQMGAELEIICYKEEERKNPK